MSRRHNYWPLFPAMNQSTSLMYNTLLGVVTIMGAHKHSENRTYNVVTETVILARNVEGLA